jgi:hypothetical protein
MIPENDNEMKVHRYGELGAIFPEEVKADILATIGNQSKLFWILCRYDFAHAPSNWEPEYKHQESILGFEKYMNQKKPKLSRKILRLVENMSEEELTTSVSQGGKISEMLYDCMINYYC